MQVGAADAAVGDFDVHVVFLEGLGRVFLPDHLALGGLLVQAHPAFELVVLGSHVVGVFIFSLEREGRMQEELEGKRAQVKYFTSSLDTMTTSQKSSIKSPVSPCQVDLFIDCLSIRRVRGGAAAMSSKHRQGVDKPQADIGPVVKAAASMTLLHFKVFRDR